MGAVDAIALHDNCRTPHTDRLWLEANADRAALIHRQRRCAGGAGHGEIAAMNARYTADRQILHRPRPQVGEGQVTADGATGHATQPEVEHGRRQRDDVALYDACAGSSGAG